MAHAALETRWGGPGATHRPIITAPMNHQSDLVLTPEVLVQPFFSFQKHEYHYKAQNGSAANNVYCNMRVEWNGPRATWSYLSPGTTDVINQSFFSPQLVHTSAQADILAGIGNPCRARQVRGEQADAYVSWTQEIWRGVWDLAKGAIQKRWVSHSWRQSPGPAANILHLRVKYSSKIQSSNSSWSLTRRRTRLRPLIFVLFQNFGK